MSSGSFTSGSSVLFYYLNGAAGKFQDIYRKRKKIGAAENGAWGVATERIAAGVDQNLKTMPTLTLVESTVGFWTSTRPEMVGVKW